MSSQIGLNRFKKSTRANGRSSANRCNVRKAETVWSSRFFRVVLDFSGGGEGRGARHARHPTVDLLLYSVLYW